MTTTDPDDKSWMLAQVEALPGVRHAFVVANDGIVVTFTEHTTDRETADPVAAACSGIISLAQQVQKLLGAAGELSQVMVESEDGFLFARRAADGSSLAVATEAAINPALIAQGMARQVQTMGERLGTPARS
ncbi:MAG TPA: roadblock/LC7 domain-containing protein [Pseudonocardiaceae bacterium]|jgi:hypothetical protein